MWAASTSEAPNRKTLSHPRILLAWVAVVTVVGGFGTGCASGGVSGYTETLWREDMGRITQATLEDGLDKVVVRKYGLLLNRDEVRGRDLYYELAWETRDIFAQEEVAGVTNARNRIVIRGRRLEASFDGSGVFRFTWEVENEVTTADTPQWHASLMPAEVVEKYRPIYSDLTLEVRAGVRR
jgi:hypothetical protein